MTVDQAFATLGIGPLFPSGVYEDDLRALAALKETARARRRELARKVHPDVGGDLEAMKQVNMALAVVEKLQLHRPQPQPVFVQVSWSPSSSTGNSTAGYTWPSS